MAEIDLDNLRKGIAKAFARFMSFAQVTCIAKFSEISDTSAFVLQKKFFSCKIFKHAD